MLFGEKNYRNRLVGKENDFYYLKKFPYGRTILSDVINGITGEKKKLEKWEKSGTVDFFAKIGNSLRRSFFEND